MPLLDRPSVTAGPLGGTLLPVALLLRQAVLTPGITRRHAPLKVFDKRRVGGRVHAVVRRGVIL